MATDRAATDVAADFPIENLPFGVVRFADGDARVVVRIGDDVFDLATAGIAPELTARADANALFESGRWHEVRDRAGEALLRESSPAALHPLDTVEVLLPIAVGDFVDFYSSIDHATNLGRILRPGTEPLLPTGASSRSATTAGRRRSSSTVAPSYVRTA